MVDAQSVADGCVQVVRVHRAVRRLHCVLVGFTDHLAALDAATGHEAAETAGVVIAARVVVDAGSAAKFAKHDNHRLFQLAGGGEVLNQRAERGIHQVPVRLHGREIVVMRIKPAPVHLHETHTGFHQPLGQQRAAAEVSIAIPGNRLGILFIQLKRLERRAAHQINRLTGGGVHRLDLRGIQLARVTQIHLGENIEAFIAAHLRDAGREREVRILRPGSTHIIGLATLAKVTGTPGVAADGNKVRQVADLFFLVHYDGTDARVNEVGALVVAGLQLVTRAAVGPVGAGNGPDQRGVLHLLGHGRENTADLDAVRAGVDGIKFTGHRAAGFGVPGVDVAHAATVPKEDDVFGSRRFGFTRARHHLRQRHAQ